MVDIIEVLEKKFKKKPASSLSFRRRRRRVEFKNLRMILLNVGEALLVVFAAFLLIYAFCYRVENLGESMTPTIRSGDRVLIDRVVYRVTDPKRDDIIAFTPSGNLNARVTLKRIVGLPGDRIEIRNGALYVNGDQYEAPVRTESIDDPGLAASPITLGKDEYFVLGDNRNNSEDSRYETIGNVRPEFIIGRAWFNVSAGNFGLME